MFRIPKKYTIHFIGIGGIGMSALACMLKNAGYRVSGSDSARTGLTESLRAQGIPVSYTHRPGNAYGKDVVVYSSGVRFSNPELLWALNHSPRTLHRMQMLSLLCEGKRCIFVTGSHGKSTTTGLIGNIFLNAGCDVNIILGAKADYLGGSNFRVGKEPLVICEIDESDGSFVGLQGETVVITNIDFEHPDYYRNRDELIASYASFVSKNRRLRDLFVCGHDENTRTLLRILRAQPHYKVYHYGYRDTCAVKIAGKKAPSYFFKGKRYGPAALCLSGEHNIRNSAAAVGVALRYKIPWRVIEDTLRSFSGVQRRLQTRLCRNGITILDDYAHHPREVKATLQAIAQRGPKRIVCVFQPHRYTRFGCFWEDFISALRKADRIFVTDVYAAGERPIPGIDSRAFIKSMHCRGIDSARYVRYNTLPSTLAKKIRPGDTVAFFGAGDIIEASARLSKLLQNTWRHRRKT